VRQAEIDNEPGYVPHPQREYRLELNSLKEAAASHGTTVLFVSQPRDKEREPVRGTGISEKVLYRVHLHPDTVHQDGTREIVASVKNVRDKSTQHQVTQFTVRPGSGIDRSRELVTVAEQLGIVVRRGPWLVWNNIQAQGTDAFDRAVHERGLIYDLDMEVRIKTGIA
jgi:RecA/RadA recombinase